MLLVGLMVIIVIVGLVLVDVFVGGYVFDVGLFGMFGLWFCDVFVGEVVKCFGCGKDC